MSDQRDRVAAMLTTSRGGVCGTTFLRNQIPRYGARLAELRRDGWVIDRRLCDKSTHYHESRQWVYDVVHP